MEVVHAWVLTGFPATENLRRINLPTDVPIYLQTYNLPTDDNLPTDVPNYLQTYQSTYRRTNLPTDVLASFPCKLNTFGKRVYLQTYQSTYRRQTTYKRTNLPTDVSIYLQTYNLPTDDNLPTDVPIYLKTYQPTYRRTNLPTDVLPSFPCKLNTFGKRIREVVRGARN
jgi:hypothetical protein